MMRINQTFTIPFLFAPIILWAQFNLYIGEVSFDYTGALNGTFLAETDSLFDSPTITDNGAVGFSVEVQDTTYLLFPAYQQATDSTFDVFFIYLRDNEGDVGPQTWTLPGDMADLGVLVTFMPDLDSATVATLLAPILDSEADSIGQDSLLLLILEELADITYFGTGGSIVLSDTSNHTLTGTFSVSMLKPLFSVIQVTNGLFQFQSFEMPPLSIAETGGILPAEIILHPNYPNPFNYSTTILYELPQPDVIRLSIIDITGREIALLNNSFHPAGRYTSVWNARRISSGIFFVRLVAGEKVMTNKILFVK